MTPHTITEQSDKLYRLVSTNTRGINSPCISPVKYILCFIIVNMNYTHTKDVTVSCSAANSLQNSLKEIL